MPQKSYLFGGILLCVVPAVLLYVAHANGFAAHSAGKVIPFPAWAFVILVVCFLWGCKTVIWSVFRLDPQGSLSSCATSIMVAGVATMCFVIAWREKGGWSGDIPFVPNEWNSVIARSGFVFVGLVLVAVAISRLRKSIERRK